MAKPKRIEIIIDKSRYDPSHKNGCEFTSVDFQASRYGSSTPCDNENQVRDAILSCKKRIIEEGDIPIIKDLRYTQKQTQLLVFARANSTFKHLKGGIKTRMDFETKQSIDSYVGLYDAIQEKTGNDAATVAILQEIGKDSRMSRIESSGSGSNATNLATEKQKDYLNALGIEFDDSITKQKASELIEKSKK